MVDSFTPAEKEDSGFDIKEAFFKYIRFLPLYIIFIALGLFTAYMYLRYTESVYSSSGSLIIKDDKVGGGGNSKFSELISTGEVINLSNEIERIKSRPLLEKVVKGLDLNFSYIAVGRFKQQVLYKDAPFRMEMLSMADSSASLRLDISFIDNDRFSVKELDHPVRVGEAFKMGPAVLRLVKLVNGDVGKDFKVTWQPTQALAGMYGGQLVVVPKGVTNILVITLESKHPQLAADIINQLMKEYGAASIEEKNETINQQLSFIDGRIRIVTKEQDSIIKNEIAKRKELKLFNPEAESATYYARKQKAEDETINLRVQSEILQSIESYLRNSQNYYSITPSTLTIADPTLSPLIAAYNSAQLEHRRMLNANISPSNQLVKENEDLLAKLRANILESIRVIKGSYSLTISNLARQNAEAQAQMNVIPEKEQEVNEIQRQKGTKQGVLTILQEQRERLAISLAATTANTAVVESAQANGVPVRPNKRNVRLIAILAALAIPTLVIFILELLNDKVVSKADIEKGTDATILGEIGHSNSDKALIVTSSNRSILAEQFRIIRSNLQYVISAKPNPVIMVTSSFSGEGKSFVSTNIGAVMALTGKKTIVLEFDIRKPKILSHLGMGKKPGLTNYIIGKANAEELPVPVEGVENLFILPCGPVPPNPSELLLNPKVESLFEYLKANFDVIVMDTAPIGMVSDATTLSRYADCTLYIVRQGRTFKKQIRFIEDLYQQDKLPNLSILVNDVKVGSGYGGYYGSRYGYASAYGYGYGQGSGYYTEEKTNFIQGLLRQTGIWKGKKQRKG